MREEGWRREGDVVLYVKTICQYLLDMSISFSFTGRLGGKFLLPVLSDDKCALFNQ